MKEDKIPMELMYCQRKNFMVVALTGITGSGCSDLAELMSKPFDNWGEVRDGEKLKPRNSADKQEVVFYKKYDLCYNVCKCQYKEPFTIIKYRNILLYTALERIALEKPSPNEIRKALAELLKQKFDKSHTNEEDRIDKDFIVNNDFSDEELQYLGLNDYICGKLIELSKLSQEDKNEYRKLLCLLYFDNGEFQQMCEKLYDELKHRNYYAKNFFVHRLATAIRATGNPMEPIAANFVGFNNENVFLIVEKINELIKGWHLVKPKRARRFVIDSVRNSMEILYLRERYNAFYMIALHNDGNEENMILEKVSKMTLGRSYTELDFEKGETALVDKIAGKIMRLSKTENHINDFEDGRFFSPDISRCVTESEIHIRYKKLSDLTNPEEKSFYSYGEQWMKIYALIVRPGLITPSHDERCMSIAYVAKFNSGCISRQVGCTIVDGEYSVQSVGWNDPPSSQLPCQLRYVDELCNKDEASYDADFHVFSRYEKEGLLEKRTEAGKKTVSFIDCVRGDINKEVITRLKEQGLKYPFCFRSRYNKYHGYKDQVNTRSLHAEENTMLRMSKVGGRGLDGGIMYVTASPCVLCSKKACQIGIRRIVYLDPYTDIAPDLILQCGWNSPCLEPFMGVIGPTFYKLYQPFLPYKDELTIWEKLQKGGQGND